VRIPGGELPIPVVEHKSATTRVKVRSLIVATPVDLDKLAMINVLGDVYPSDPAHVYFKQSLKRLNRK
jgi:hypothetical protein